MTDTRPALPKVGGSGRTMIVGMGVVGTGLIAWYFAQFRIHKRDNQTWIWRQGQQDPGAIPSGVGPRPQAIYDIPDVKPGSVPLPGNADSRGSQGIIAKLMGMHLGRGLHADGTVPEQSGNVQQPAHHRRNSDGSYYTKSGYYAEGYKRRPSDPNALKSGRS